MLKYRTLEQIIHVSYFLGCEMKLFQIQFVTQYLKFIDFGFQVQLRPIPTCIQFQVQLCSIPT